MGWECAYSWAWVAVVNAEFDKECKRKGDWQTLELDLESVLR
jgi:hypothetical protein